MEMTLQQIINLRAPLLLTGPTGAGKSYLAREIFTKSSIYQKKFITMHLASIKEDLIESELFGHVKGAFTGATEKRAGYLQEAMHGTLFLDEIGELSLEAQKKLLYFLEERRFTPIGSSSSLNFDGRIIMATNKNIDQMLREGKMREDFYFRIKTFQFELKALRDHTQELPHLLRVIFQSLEEKYQLPKITLTKEAFDLIAKHPWVGNIRELKNTIEFIVLTNETTQLTARLIDHFLEKLPKSTNGSAQLESSLSAPEYHLALESFEKTYLSLKLEENHGKINQTARAIKISKTALIYKMRAYDLNVQTQNRNELRCQLAS